MNELIRELEAQAENYAESKLEEGYAYDEIHFFYRQKFAELIVQECLNNMENCDGDLDFAIWKTKTDFGVEE
jgi:hypothetical protein